MNGKTLALAFVGFASGVAIGYLIAPGTVTPPAREAVASRRSARMSASSNDAALGKLRQRVKELERRLAEATDAKSVPAKDAENGVGGENAPSAPPSPMGNFTAYMEKIKQQDPQRHAQMTNRMARWRARHIAETQDRMDFFASLDTSTMTPKELENHDKLQQLIMRREELMQSLSPENADLTAAERENVFREMRATQRQLVKLEQAERDMLLRQTVRNLGCQGSVAKELVDTIKTIYNVTQSGGRHHGPPSGRR